MSFFRKPRHRWGLLLGAAFLMATSAIGPGFLTQTSVFTAQFGASFGFVILMSVLLDIGAQMNVWRVIAIAEQRAQDIANAVLPGLGYMLAAFIVLGGLAFNIGNIAGAGLGVNVLLGFSVEVGAVLSAAIAIGIFLWKEAGRAMDRVTQSLGLMMVGLTLYVAVTARPPVDEALLRTLAPAPPEGQRDAFLLSIVTLVGGTVGGYITFAGAHRLLDGGIKGKESLPQVTRSSVSGILVTAVMRGVLFLAALGVVAQGAELDPKNPPASVFQLAAGPIGYKLFGMVMWAAAITSVAGSAYTSVSFLRTFHRALDNYYRGIIIGFIATSTVIFVWVGRPVALLILAGALNGLVLPISLAILLIAAHCTTIVHDYKHPWWMTFAGALVAVAMACLGTWTLVTELPKLIR